MQGSWRQRTIPLIHPDSIAKALIMIKQIGEDKSVDGYNKQGVAEPYDMLTAILGI